MRLHLLLSLSLSFSLSLSLSLETPTHRTQAYHNSFHSAAVYLWNSLFPEIVSSPLLAIFKVNLHEYLMSAHTEKNE